MRSRNARLSNIHRSGFTLVELLIVVSILILLTTMTVMSINFSYSRDRVRAAGRQLQSFIAGARDRAIYSKEVRGVRLILAPNSNHVVVAMQYIGSPDVLSQGSVTFPGLTGDTIVIPNGMTLQRAGLLNIGSQIEIPKDSGSYFTVASRAVAFPAGSNSPDGQVVLDRAPAKFSGQNSQSNYALRLRPTILANSEPVQLPAGVAIDLDGSKVPAAWRPVDTNSTRSYSLAMDILFNPRGNVVGDAAANGFLHFLIADVGDIEQWRNITGRVQKVSPTSTEWAPPVVPANGATPPPIVKRDQVIVSVNGRTGNVGVYHVNTNPVVSLASGSAAGDPFKYAEIGHVSK